MAKKANEAKALQADLPPGTGDRRSLGFFGSLGTFLALCALSLVLFMAGVDARDVFGQVVHSEGVEQLISALLEEPAPDSSDPADSDSQASLAEDDSEEAEPPSFDLSGNYYYDQLNDEDREKYELVYRALANLETVQYPGTSKTDINRVYNYVMADHPDFFYVEGFYTSVYDADGYTDFSGTIVYSQEDVDNLHDQVDAALESIVSQVPGSASDFEKARIVFETLANNISYDHYANENMASLPFTQRGQTTVEALLQRKCVCAGYSRAYQAIMQRLGYTCVYVTGDLKKDDDSHAWNLIQLDGDWYYVDATWGDPDSVDNYEPGTSSEDIRYEYLCATTADMQVSREFEAWQLLPDCTATADSYYVHEKLMLDSADIAKIQAWGNASMKSGANRFEFKCSSKEIYDAVLQALDDWVSFEGDPAYSFNYWDDSLVVVVAIDR